MTPAYKIVEVVKGEVRTLFHGLNGSRKMPRGVWLEAEYKPVRDGSNGTWYMSGWHVFLSLAACKRYLKGRFAPRRIRCVLCQVRGYRPKEHSTSPVKLARWIRF